MYIQLNSQVIYYERTGEGSPIILLHGNGESHQIFDVLSQDLAQDYTVYAMDSRGQGESATPHEYHYADMAEDVVALIHALEIDHPIIYGYSDGGIVGLLVAMKYPNILSKLIISGANHTPKGLTGAPRREIKSHYKKTNDPLYKLMMEEPNINPEALSSITVPVLVLAGEKDIVKSSETKKIASALADATLRILSKETHGSYVVHSEKLAPLIREFIS